MCALGEMAAWLPLPSGFTGYAVRFVDPALGFTLGWTYVRPISVEMISLTRLQVLVQVYHSITKPNDCRCNGHIILDTSREGQRWSMDYHLPGNCRRHQLLRCEVLR